MPRNDEIRIRMNGKKDQNGNDYYLAVTQLPSSVDLSHTIFVLFPDEQDDGKFGADLVIRRYQGRKEAETQSSSSKRRRTATTTQKNTDDENPDV